MSRDGREGRQSFVNTVLKSMKAGGYNPPASTLEAFTAWVDDNNSATASSFLDAMRAFKAWLNPEIFCGREE